jgi:DNA-binding CsgD family transcriptional regulator/uncharacterized protein (DUF433 family)
MAQEFFDRIRSDLDQIARLVGSAGDALASGIRDADRVLLNRPEPGNPGNPGNSEPEQPEGFRELFGFNPPPEPQFDFEETFGVRPERVSPQPIGRRGQQPRLDPDEALRMHREGRSNFEIAEHFGVTPRYVGQVLRARGVRQPRGSPARIPKEEVARLHHEGMHPRDIAGHLGASEVRVGQILRELGLDPVGGRATLEERHRRIQGQVLELHRQGLTPQEIAAQVNIAYTRVYGILREADLAPNVSRETLEARREAQRRHAEIIRMHQEGMTLGQIGLQFGISHQAVSRHLQAVRRTTTAGPAAPGTPIPIGQLRDRSREFEDRAYALLPLAHSLWWDQSEDNIRLVEMALTNLWNEAGEYVAQSFWWEGPRVVWMSEESRWRVAFVRDRLGRAIEELETLRVCLAQMELAQETALPRLIEQARGCILRAVYLIMQCCPRPPLPSPTRTLRPIPGLAEGE